MSHVVQFLHCFCKRIETRVELYSSTVIVSANITNICFFHYLNVMFSVFVVPRSARCRAL